MSWGQKCLTRFWSGNILGAGVWSIWIKILWVRKIFIKKLNLILWGQKYLFGSGKRIRVRAGLALYLLHCMDGLIWKE